MKAFIVGSKYLFVRHYLVLHNGIREYQSLFNFPAKSHVHSEIISLTCIAEADSSFTFFDRSQAGPAGHVFSDGNGAYFYNRFRSQDAGFGTSTVRDRDTFDDYLLIEECLSGLISAQIDGSITNVQQAILAELTIGLRNRGYAYNLSVEINEGSLEEIRESA